MPAVTQVLTDTDREIERERERAINTRMLWLRHELSAWSAINMGLFC